MWDLKDLGVQATQRIAKASDALRSLGDISQNFPNLAATLSRSTVDKAVRAELRSNQAGLPGGALPPSLSPLYAMHSPQDFHGIVPARLSANSHHELLSTCNAVLYARHSPRGFHGTVPARLSEDSHHGLLSICNADLTANAKQGRVLRKRDPIGHDGARASVIKSVTRPAAIARHAHSSCGVGANFMLLNGLFMDPEVDLYDLLDRIRTEVCSLCQRSELVQSPACTPTRCGPYWTLETMHHS